jgi:hypothetical protein
VGSVFAFLAEHRRIVFADLFVSSAERPSIPADVIASVLTYWRRLKQSERPDRSFDAVRDVVTQTGR